LEHHYELIVIVDGNKDEAESNQEFTRVGETVTQYEGLLGEIQPWGKRKLAYEIRGRREGYYASLFFSGGPRVLAELDRGLKLNENVIRHLVLRREPGSAPPPPAMDSAGATTETAPAEAHSAEAAGAAPGMTTAAEAAPMTEPVTPAPGA
jgi:small subunit ribosomal protein S6